MNAKTMSIKSKIKSYAKKLNVPAQVFLQNYMFERLLERVSLSDYKDKIIIKGGVLIASLVGLSTRSTMDLDTTIRNLPFTKLQIYNIFSSICSIKLEDEVTFEIKSINEIRKDDIYGGYRIRIDAIYETIITPLSIDVSTGDKITPHAIEYKINSLFNENLEISLWGYNIETVLAEKVETILNRGIFSTRPKDFYDMFILTKNHIFNKDIFYDALIITSKHRGTFETLNNVEEIIFTLSKSEELEQIWRKYRSTFSYANDISYKDIIATLQELLKDFKT